MFFREPNLLPEDLIMRILNELPSSGISSLSITTQMREIMKNNTTLWKNFGADDFNDFMTKIANLPEEYYPRIADNTFTLQDAKMHFMKRIKAIPNQYHSLIAKKFFTLRELENLIQPVNSLVGNASLFLERVKIALSIEPKLSQYYTTLDAIENHMQDGDENAYTKIKQHMYPLGMHTAMTYLRGDFIIAIKEGLIQFDQITKIPENVYTNVIAINPNLYAALKRVLITGKELETLKPNVLNNKIDRVINILKLEAVIDIFEIESKNSNSPKY